MKKYLFLLVLFSLISLEMQAQVKVFEGYVEFKSEFVGEGEEENLNMDMKYFIKGNRFRAELPSAEGTNILLSDGDKSYMLLPEIKKYLDLSGFETQANAEDNTIEDITKAKTGEMKDILGYKCEKYIFKESDNISEVWITKELGTFMFAATPMEKSIINNSIFKDGFFPLEIVIKEINGKETGKVYVTKIEKQQVNDSMFNIPADYTKMDMPSMDFNMNGEE